MPTSITTVAKEDTLIVPFFITYLTCLALNTLPVIRAYDVTDFCEVHACWMPCTTTLNTSHHHLGDTLSILAISAAEPAFLLLRPPLPL